MLVPRLGPVTLAIAVLGACAAPAGDADTSRMANEPAPGPGIACEGASMALLDGTCAPVGPEGVAEGFVATPWADAVRPVERCAGATRAVLGSTACQPIDDCAKAFPPPEATVTVHPGPNALTAALARAPSGAVLALDAGEYEPVVIAKNVTLIGRCAEKVVVKGSPDGRGVAVQGSPEVVLRSLTVRGAKIGLYANGGGKTHVDHVLFADNRAAIALSGGALDVTASAIDVTDKALTDTFGVSVFAGAVVTLNAVDVRGTDAAFDANGPKTTMTVQRSVAGFEQAGAARAVVSAWRGADITVRESALSSRDHRLLAVGRVLATTPEASQKDPPATLHVLKSSLVQQGKARASGSVADAWDGGTLELEDSVVRHQSYAAVGLSGATTLLRMNRSSILAVGQAPSAAAVMVLDGARADIEQSAVIDAVQVGISARGKGSSVALHRTLIRGTRQGFLVGLDDLGGTGQAVAVGRSARATIVASTIAQGTGIGVFALEGSVALEDSLIDDTRADGSGQLGEGVVGIDAEVAVRGGSIRRSSDAAFSFEGGAGVIDGSTIADAALGVRAGRVEVVFAENTEPTVGKVFVPKSTRFERVAKTTGGLPVAVPIR